MAPGDGTSSQPTGNSTGGALIAVYGVIVYLMFVLTFLYLIGFVVDADFVAGNTQIVAKSIDRGGLGDGTLTVTAVIVDTALLGLFAVQHSVMARQGFKRLWTRIVHPSAERSTYVLASNVVLIVLVLAWYPITYDVWRVAAQPWAAVLTVTGLVGWAIALLSTLLIDHFDLFGLRQVFARLRGRQLPEHKFTTPLFYRAVRHPLYLGFLIAFWVTPRMTLGHLIFAAASTGYILVAVRFEERDLVRVFGEEYSDYRRRVPMLIPGMGDRSRHARPTG